MRKSEINTNTTVPQIKQNQVKVKQETARSSKVSLSEKIPIEQIKDTFICQGFGTGVSKQFSMTAAGGNIERLWNKITILWYMRKH